MEDAETGEQLYVDTHDAAFRLRFQEAARRREAALSETFKRAGVDALSLSTEEDLVRAIVRFATAAAAAPAIKCGAPYVIHLACDAFFTVADTVFVVLYIRMQHRRRRLAASYGSLGLGQGVAGQRPGFRHHIPPGIFLIGLTLLLFALARPKRLSACRG